jgi:hypothetical protein
MSQDFPRIEHRRLGPISRTWWLFVLASPVLLIWFAASLYFESTRGPHGPSLKSPSSIAVSRAEEVFVYDNPGVRVFDRDGAEVRRWRVHSYGGSALLAFDPAGVLHLATARHATHYQYDTRGNILDATPDPDAWERLSVASRWSARGPSGDLYQIRGRAIIRVTNAGVAQVVVPGLPSVFPSNPYLLLPYCVLLPAFGVLLRETGRRRV